jgi:hypothetical protein
MCVMAQPEFHVSHEASDHHAAHDAGIDRTDQALAIEEHAHVTSVTCAGSSHPDRPERRSPTSSTASRILQPRYESPHCVIQRVSTVSHQARSQMTELSMTNPHGSIMHESILEISYMVQEDDRTEQAKISGPRHRAEADDLEVKSRLRPNRDEDTGKPES